MKEDKIRTGYITSSFSRALKCVGLLRTDYNLAAPQQKRTKSQVATSLLPSRGPEGGWYCYATLVFSAVLNRRGQNQKWQHHACFMRGPNVGCNAT